MNIERIEEKLRATLPATVKNVEEKAGNLHLYKDSKELTTMFDKVRNILCGNDKECGAELLSSDVVTGLWIFTNLVYDDRPQLLIRLSRTLSNTEQLLLNSELFKYIGHDIFFVLDRDVYDGDSVIVGQQEELSREIEAENLLMIFDSERE